MAIEFEKARELGEILLKSELGLRMADARAALENNQEAVKELEDFKKYQADAQQSMKLAGLSQEEYTKIAQNIAMKSNELKNNPVISELIKWENEFYAYVNQVLGVVKSTLSGEFEEEKSCGGCNKCH